MMDTEVAFKLAKFSFKNAIKSNNGLAYLGSFSGTITKNNCFYLFLRHPRTQGKYSNSCCWHFCQCKRALI